MKWPFGSIEDEEDVDVDTYMKELTMGTGDLPEEEEQEYKYLKSINIMKEEDMDRVEKEIKKGNLVMMNVKGLFKDRTKLRNAVEKAKEITSDLRGDICRVSEEKLLLVPAGMEVIA